MINSGAFWRISFTTKEEEHACNSRLLSHCSSGLMTLTTADSKFLSSLSRKFRSYIYIYLYSGLDNSVKKVQHIFLNSGLQQHCYSYLKSTTKVKDVTEVLNPWFFKFGVQRFLLLDTSLSMTFPSSKSIKNYFKKAFFHVLKIAFLI